MPKALYSRTSVWDNIEEVESKKVVFSASAWLFDPWKMKKMKNIGKKLDKKLEKIETILKEFFRIKIKQIERIKKKFICK